MVAMAEMRRGRRKGKKNSPKEGGTGPGQYSSETAHVPTPKNLYFFFASVFFLCSSFIHFQ